MYCIDFHFPADSFVLISYLREMRLPNKASHFMVVQNVQEINEMKWSSLGRETNNM
jgi:hypothetical protein